MKALRHNDPTIDIQKNDLDIIAPGEDAGHLHSILKTEGYKEVKPTEQSSSIICPDADRDNTLSFSQYIKGNLKVDVMSWCVFFLYYAYYDHSKMDRVICMV